MKFLVNRRTITNVEIIGGQTKIYADFSQITSGYWSDYGGLGAEESYNWAYVSSSYGNERYMIEEMTNEYILVDGVYGITPGVGNIVYLTRVRGNQSNWSIVGEGSSRDEIITWVPVPNQPSIKPAPNQWTQHSYIR